MRLLDRGRGARECIAALCAAVKIAAEALSGAGGLRIRTLKVGVRVVRRSGQRRSESRGGWLVSSGSGGFRN